MRKKITFALFVGIVSFALQLVDQLLKINLFNNQFNGFVFISFITWGLYSIMADKEERSYAILLSYGVGIVFSLIMIGVGNLLGFAGIFTMPLMALIVVPFMMLCDRLPKYLNHVPIYFIASGSFFGIYNLTDNLSTLSIVLTVLLYASLGVICAKICDYFSNNFQKEPKEVLK